MYSISFVGELFYGLYELKCFFMNFVFINESLKANLQSLNKAQEHKIPEMTRDLHVYTRVER